MRTYRYCHRCQGQTEHYEPDPLRLPASLILFWPLARILGRWADPPSCLVCLKRQHRGDGDRAERND
jgi:hypothetical protein